MVSIPAPDIKFNRENAAIAAFDKVQEEDRRERLSQLKEEQLRLDNEFARLGMPSRLRTMDAGARGAEAGADVAQGTVAADIEGRRARSRLSTVEADTAEKTAPFKVRGAEAGTRKAEAGADVSEASVPYDIWTRKANARLRTTQADAGDRALLTDILNDLTSDVPGIVERAKAKAKQFGVDLPPELVNDREMAVAFKNGVDYTDRIFAGRPRDQEAWGRKYLAWIKGRREQGLSVSDPSLPYQFESGIQPQETKAERGVQDPADVRTAEWMMRNGVAKDANEAWGLVRLSRSNPQQAYTSVYNTALRATFGDAARAKQIADEFVANMQSVSTFRDRFSPMAPGASPGVQQGPPMAPSMTGVPARPPAQRVSQDPSKPLDIQLPPQPPTVPPGSAYSPSRRMWRSPDGRFFDENGQQVAQ